MLWSSASRSTSTRCSVFVLRRRGSTFSDVAQFRPRGEGSWCFGVERVSQSLEALRCDTGDVIDGHLAPAKVATVRSWCERHRDALRSDWQRTQLNLHPAGRYDQ
jgi:hypothetical protein